jgi:phage replication O-like protein O
MENDKSPKLEDGYTRISNELLEAIFRYGFSQNEFRVLLSIMRHTYGWRKKTADLSLSFIAKASGVPRRSVVWAINHLREQNVIIRTASNTGIQKDYGKWVVQPIALGQPITLQPIALELVQPIALELVQPIAHKKEKKTKENKNTTAAPALQRVISDRASQIFTEKFGTKPTWTAADYVQLTKLLRARTGVTVEEFDERYKNFLSSQVGFHQQQGGSLKFFVTHYDGFIKSFNGSNGSGQQQAEIRYPKLKGLLDDRNPTMVEGNRKSPTFPVTD